MDVRSVAFSPDSRYILFVGKGKSDKDYRFYVFSKKDVKPLDIKSDSPVVPNGDYRISWAKGWIF
jgi:hypothetical protein